jgi:hypothetical protein
MLLYCQWWKHLEDISPEDTAATILRDDTVADLLGADCVCLRHLERTLRIGEKLAKRGKTLAGCVG